MADVVGVSAAGRAHTSTAMRLHVAGVGEVAVDDRAGNPALPSPRRPLFFGGQFARDYKSATPGSRRRSGELSR